MRGASVEGKRRVLGGSLHTKGDNSLYFLALRNLRNFELATKEISNVSAPWVRLCIRLPSVAWIALLHIHTLRGDSTIAHSVAMVFLRYPEERNELVWLLAFLL